MQNGNITSNIFRSKMERMGNLDEDTDENKQARYEIIQNTIRTVEENLPITEDFLADCQDLILSYHSNFINAPTKLHVIEDETYVNKLKQTNRMAEDIVTKVMNNEPFSLTEFYKFCKNIVELMNRLDYLDSADDLSAMMATLSVKTKTRKLRR